MSLIRIVKLSTLAKKSTYSFPLHSPPLFVQRNRWWIFYRVSKRIVCLAYLGLFSSLVRVALTTTNDCPTRNSQIRRQWLSYVWCYSVLNEDKFLRLSKRKWPFLEKNGLIKKKDPRVTLTQSIDRLWHNCKIRS